MDTNNQERRQSHKNFHFNITEDCDIKISSDFDSGNMQSANICSITDTTPIKTVKIDLTPASEPFNPQYSSRPSNKTFFHFSIQCTHQPIILHAMIRRMSILGIIENNFEEYYKICVGYKTSAYQEPQYEKIRPECLNLLKVGEQHYLEFKYKIQPNETTFFSYHFPYSVEKLRFFLEEVQEEIKKINQNQMRLKNTEIYYKNQLLIQSLEQRPINLITITQGNTHIYPTLPREQRISKSLFPYYDLEDRPFKFSKPYIMLSCRVHPGQTSASFGLQGFIRKLLDFSPQSEFLLKSFVFIIVPMLNPDGVYHGTYRMDTLGHNLNRFYNGSAPHRHPSIFAVQALIQHHSEDIVGYFDIHAHPSIKGSFFYGNAFSNLHEQIQSQLFAKIFSFNSESFIYEQCSFSERNMNSKDINDILTKDGSARVCAYKKMPSAIHCYTLQMGYHGFGVKKQPPIPCPFKNQYRRRFKFFNTFDFLEEGAALAVTIAQIYYHNLKPVTLSCLLEQQKLKSIDFSLQNNQTKEEPLLINSSNANSSYLQILRQQIGKQIYEKQERFKIMDAGLLKKLKNAHKEINSLFYNKLVKKHPNLEEAAKVYSNHLNKNKKRLQAKLLQKEKKPEKQFKPIHSLQLNKKIKRNNHQIGVDQLNNIAENSAMFSREKNQTNPTLADREDISARLRIAGEHTQYLAAVGLQRNGRIKLADPYDATDLGKIMKSKIHVTPVEFHLPPQNKKVRRGISGPPKNQTNLNNLLHLQSLPKIDKKKLKLVADRNKSLKVRRISSSLNSQKLIEAQQVDLHFNKMTIENKMDEIINFEEKINHQLEKQQKMRENSISEKRTEKILSEENDEKKRKSSGDELLLAKKQILAENAYNPQGFYLGNFDQMNNVYNDGMYRRISSKRQSQREKVMKNYQTDRLHKKILRPEKFVSSRDKSIRPQNKQKGEKKVNMLPKLQGKTEKIRNRFDLELKLREKYDKQYFVQ